MAAWQDFWKKVRLDEDDEQKRRDMSGFGGWMGNIRNSFDNIADTGEAVFKGDFKGAGQQIGQYAKDTGRVLNDVREVAEDTGQSVARFGAETAMSAMESGRDRGDEQLKSRIDQVLEVDKKERERIAKDDNDPRSYLFRMTKKQFGNLDDETLKKRKAEIAEKDAADDTWKPTNPVAKAIFGGEDDEKSRTVQKRTADYEGNIQSAGEFAGIDQGLLDNTKTPLAAIGAVGAMALDSPFGKPASTGAKAVKELGSEGIEFISKSVNPDDIVAALSKSANVTKLGDDTIRAAAEKLKDITDPKEVTKLIKGIKKIKPEVAPLVDDVAETASKGFPIDPKTRAAVDAVTPDTPGSRQVSPLADEMAAGYSNTDEVVDDLVDHWWKYDKSAKGGQLIDTNKMSDPYGAEVGVKRISEHSPFYSRFFKENGRAPTKADFKAEVTKQLDMGDGDLILGKEISDAYGIVKDRVSSLEQLDSPPVQNTPQAFTDVIRQSVGPDPLNPTTNVKPGRTRLRSFLQTAQNSPALTDDTKAAIAAVDPQKYTQEQQAPIMEEARKLVETNQDEARRIIEDGGQFDARKSAILQQYIRKLSQEGRGVEAAEYAERLSNEGLKAGRGNAMIAAMNRLSPEGILVLANKTVERYTKQATKGVINKVSRIGKGGKPEDIAKQIQSEVEGAGKITSDNVSKAIKELTGDGEGSKSVGEKVAKRIEGDMTPKKKQKVDELVNELTKKIRQEQLAPKPVGPKRSATQVLREVFQRNSEAQDAWPEAQDILRANFADNPDVLKQLDSFFASTIKDGVINAKSTLDNAVKETLRRNEVQVSKIIEKSWADQAKTVDDMAADLTKEGFSPESAKIIAKQATDNLNKQVADSKKRVLDNLMKKVPERARPTYEEKIAKLSNIGALNDKDYLQIAQKRLDLPTLDDAAANKISKLAQDMQALPDGPEKDKVIRDIMDAIADTMPVTAKQKFEAYRYQNLLSSPRTQMRNILANTFNTLVTRPATLFTGAAGDTASSMLTGKPRERYFAELPQYYRGLVKGWFDSTDAAKAAWKGEADLSNPDFADVFGQTGIDQAMRRKLPKKWTVVSRAMEAQDKIFSGMIAGGEYAAQIKRGVPEAQAREAAHAMAEYSLLRQALDPKNATGQGLILSKIDQATAGLVDAANGWGGAGRWIIPFVRTPLNFGKQWLEFSPGGLVNAVVDKSMSPERRIEALNKGLLGTSVMGMGAALAADDRITWALPKNEKDRDLFYSEGKKPYSVKVGDQWIPLINFGPFGLAMAVPAAIKENFIDGADVQTTGYDQKILKTAMDVGRMLSDQTFLNGLGDFIAAFEGNNPDSVKKAAANLFTQVIPLSGLQRYVSTVIDPTYREPKGFVENLTAGIPGFSLGMEEQTNSVTGEPIKRNWSDYVAPYSVGQENPDPVRQGNTEMMAEFYRSLRQGGDDRTNTNEKITEALSQGNEQEALRLATEHNQRVSSSLQGFREQYGEVYRNNPTLLDQFMRDYQSALIANPLSRSSMQSRSRGINKQKTINEALNK